MKVWRLWEWYKRFFFWKKKFYVYIIKKSNYWTLFKRFFVFKKRINIFSRFKWFFNNSRVLKKYYLKVYGLKNVHALKRKYFYCLKQSSFKTYNYLSALEFRIDLVSVRLHFVSDIKKAKRLIKLGYLLINNISINRFNYIFSINDMLEIKSIQYFITLGDSRKKIQYRKRKWYKRNLCRSFNYVFFYKNIIKNFLEVNYRIGGAIYIRMFFLSEIIKKKRVQEFKWKLFKKFWNFN